MNKVTLPSHYNYIGIFLTLGCNLSCSYCINHTVGLNQKRKHLNAQQWITGLKRIKAQTNLPFSLQGGEPTIHPGIYDILNGLNHPVDLLTNLQFSAEKFIKNVSPSIFSRNLPYPAIRVSYHPETMVFEELINKVLLLESHGHSIGLFSVDHPKYKNHILEAKSFCEKNNIFFKTKPLLAKFDGKVYGDYHYKDACFSDHLKTCECKTSELLIDPYGDIYRCHHDLYNKINPQGNILDSNLSINDTFKTCHYYGNCNPCDIKIKNNRFQQFGHASVEIRNIK